jgi:hypothetical protein
MVKPEELVNRERELAGRRPGDVLHRIPESEIVRPLHPVEEHKSPWQQRIEKLRPARSAHCGHCYGEGRDAALTALLVHASGEGEGMKGSEDGVKAAREAHPRGLTDVHCGHCFAEGKEAALRAYEAKGEPEPSLVPGAPGEHAEKAVEPPKDKAPKQPHTPPAHA